MYVLNDMTRDSRVIREASTLAGAGHQVTVMATTRSRDEPSGTREVRDGFEIIHVALPAGRPLIVTWIRRPWRLLRWAALRWLGALRGGPAEWPIAIAVMLGSVVSVPWVVVRGAWYAASTKVLARTPRRTWLDYLVWWRHTILGWGRAAVELAPVADVHHGHDMDGLAIAAAGARRDSARLVYDSHEIFSAWGVHAAQPWIIRAVTTRWERRMARQAAAVVTVNEACAAELSRRLRTRRTVVVHNCPPRWTMPAERPDLLRRAAAIPASAPVVLCHGGFQPGRGLEETAAALLEPGLEDAHLVFLGYRLPVVEPLAADPRFEGRIHLIDAVSPDALIPWVASADVDVMAIAGTMLTYRLSTPNKLFESLAAGVPVVASDFTPMRQIVCDASLGPLGRMCDPADPASIAAAIRSILEASPGERIALRERCLAASRTRWNWETESRRLVDLYADLERTSRAGPRRLAAPPPRARSTRGDDSSAHGSMLVR